MSNKVLEIGQRGQLSAINDVFGEVVTVTMSKSRQMILLHVILYVLKMFNKVSEVSF